ncbi:hypothetical protein CDAR_605381, partial [Caerostris darwini]
QLAQWQTVGPRNPVVGGFSLVACEGPEWLTDMTAEAALSRQPTRSFPASS